MSLRFICGRSGTGKSEYCYNEIKEKIENKEKIIIITPEQFSFTAEKKLMDITKNGSTVNAEVITLSRMAFRVLQDVRRKFRY